MNSSPQQSISTDGESCNRLREVIRTTTGIEISPDKDYLIASRLGSLLRDFNFTSFDDLAAEILRNSDPNLRELFEERIATHETLFFRDESMFTALAAQIIPEWLERNRGQSARPFRVWSAGCATGQEPYSLAMLIREKSPQLFDRTRILASDLSVQSLRRGQQGVYSRYEIGRGLPEEYAARYFRSHESGLAVVAEIKEKIDWIPLNLALAGYPSGFDLILCRNVLIYFDDSLRRKVLEGLRGALNADGVLVLGSAESPQGYVEGFVIRTCGLARYYEFNHSRITLFNTEKEGA